MINTHSVLCIVDVNSILLLYMEYVLQHL